MTFTIFALIIGIALGTVLKGVLKIALTVVLCMAALVFACHELHVDWRSMLHVAADEATEQYEHAAPVVRHRIPRSNPWL